MTNFQAISNDRHARKRWRAHQNYSFASQEALVPLLTSELSKAVLGLPIAFTRQGSDFILVAVLSLQQQRNMLVAADGRWIGHYIPAAIRSYPFRLLPIAENGPLVLCIDEDSGCVTEGPEGTPFFGDDSKPAQATQELLGFLEQMEQDRRQTIAICALLDKHKLIQPWPITVRATDGDHRVDGLFRIDEQALNNLSPDALHEISRNNGLFVAYCQLISMQHLALLGKLAEMHARATAEAVTQPAPTQADILSQSGEILNFDGVR